MENIQNWFQELLFSCFGCVNRNDKKEERQIRDISTNELKEMLDDLLALDSNRQIVDFPLHFFCPLSGEFLYDPIIIPTGTVGTVSCDTLFIQQWVIDNHSNPFDRSPLDIANLKPDKKLKEEIYGFLLDELEIFEEASPQERPTF